MEATSNNWFTNKYPIGYALSGGFIKGFAHLGVMQSLLEHDIKPNILSGVSAGALAGVFYADGKVDMGRRNIQSHPSGRLTRKAFARTPLLPLSEKCSGKETSGLLPYTQYAHARSFRQVCTHLAQDVLYSEPLKRKCMVILMPLQLFNGYIVKLHHS